MALALFAFAALDIASKKGKQMAFDEQRKDLEARRRQARAMGSPKRLAERKADGILNARERIDHLFDAASFSESGLLAHSQEAEMPREKSPADGMVSGFGRVDGRLVGVNAADFTTLGSSSARIQGKKQDRIRDLCVKNGIPLAQLIECGGGRIPDFMGAVGMGTLTEGRAYHRPRIIPSATAILGKSFGYGAFSSVLSDYTVMRKGAVMAVSSDNVTSVAISESGDEQALGGWDLHTSQTGLVDKAVGTDQEAIEVVKRYLSYMPDHNRKITPRTETPAGSDDACASVDALLPENRAQVYDVRKIIQAIVDPDSWFPVKERFAKVAVTGLARLDGRAIGIVATNPYFKGGALDPDACDKITNFIVTCDSFNIPMIFLHDTPGFLVGAESERNRLAGKIVTFVQALELATVPTIALVMRKSFGQAMLNMGVGKTDETVCWFAGEISFMDPAVAVSVAYNLKQEDDPDRFAELLQEVTDATSAYDLAGAYVANDVIDPRETRAYLINALNIHCRRLSGGVGEHLLQNWPAAY
jgi:acetyl-CoA carboxylase carboxyltransferase component